MPNPEPRVAAILEQAQDCLLPREQASSMPLAAYTDDEWYDQERHQLFHQGWVGVARSAELAEPNQFVTANIAGEPCVVVRNRNGELQALSNVCPHRSSTILGDASGSAPSLQCSYHQWTFDHEGHLRVAPGMDQVQGFDPAEVCLQVFAVDEWHGFVFVNIDNNAQRLNQSAPMLDQLFTEHRLAECVSLGSRSYPSPWNWKITAENFLESYHHRGIHPETLEVSYPGLQSFALLEGAEPWSGVDHVSAVEDQLPFIALAAYPSLLVAIERGAGALWFRTAPVSAEETALTIEVLVLPERVDVPDLATMMLDSVERINDEDVSINKRTALGARSKFARPGRVSHLEGSPWHFRRWIVEQMSRAGGPTL